jgi:hypothetical protein
MHGNWIECKSYIRYADDTLRKYMGIEQRFICAVIRGEPVDTTMTTSNGYEKEASRLCTTYPGNGEAMIYPGRRHD